MAKNKQSRQQKAFLFPGLLSDLEGAIRTGIIDPMTKGTGLTDIEMQRAQNQIFGGYGRAGLAGSGIAQEGAQQAIGQIGLQAQQRNQAALSNLIGASTIGQAPPKQQAQAGGLTVICTELHNQGLLPNEVYEADNKFGKSLPAEVLAGYHLWAVPVVRLMKKSGWFTRFVWLATLPWAKEIYAREHGVKGSPVGKLMLLVGIPTCKLLGELTLKTTPEFVRV